MAIRPSWENAAKTVITFEFEGRWTWDDLYHASDLATTMLHEVDHTVDFILDVRHASQMPSDFMSHAGHIAGGTNPKRGLLIVVGANFILRTLGNTLRKFFSDAMKDVVIVGTLEEAHVVIASQREAR
jgi:hypothetical protein